MRSIEIFTDGACSGNPGPGGWGAIIRYDGKEEELSGFDLKTTNNRMELTAVIMVLNSLRRPCSVVISTDSEYVQKGITLWINAWKANGWKTANKKPVKIKIYGSTSIMRFKGIKSIGDGLEAIAVILRMKEPMRWHKKPLR